MMNINDKVRLQKGVSGKRGRRGFAFIKEAGATPGTWVLDRDLSGSNTYAESQLELVTNDAASTAQTGAQAAA